MREQKPGPQINVSKIVAGGGIAGAIFAVTSILILLFGIPALWYFLPAAFVLGFGVALLLRFARHETPGKPWILSATEQPAPQKGVRRNKSPHTGLLLRLTPF